VLCAVDDQDIFRVRRKVLAGQMAGDNFPLGEPPGMRLIAQMRVNIARHRQLPERLAQRIALRRQRRIVEVKIHDIGGHHLLIDPMPRRQREVAHEGAAAGFAADQPHLFQFTVDAWRWPARGVLRRQGYGASADGCRRAAARCGSPAHIGRQRLCIGLSS
jgi:hypothetical protein